ncbi:MAG: outer membrane lipoprotein-sorting protein [Spirochaetales bacterium]
MKTHKKSILYMNMIFALFFFAAPLFTQTMTVDNQVNLFDTENLSELMSFVQPFDRKAVLYAQVDTVVIEKNGTQKTMAYELFSTREEDIVTLMIHVHNAKGYDNTRLLITLNETSGHVSASVMMPFFFTPLRIKTLSPSTPFFFSDFIAEDITPRHVASDSYRLIAQDTSDDTQNNCLIVECIPNGNSNYAKMIYYIDTNTMLAMKTELYDSKNQKVKVLEVLDTATPNDIVSATVLKMSDLQNNSYTLVTFTDIVYHTDVSRFTCEQYLKTGNADNP